MGFLSRVLVPHGRRRAGPATSRAAKRASTPNGATTPKSRTRVGRAMQPLIPVRARHHQPGHHPRLMIRISGRARRGGRRRSAARSRRQLIRAPRQAAGWLLGSEPVQSSGPPWVRRAPARARWLVWIVTVLVASAVGGALGIAAVFGLAEIARTGTAGSVFASAVAGGMVIGTFAVPVADIAVQLIRSWRRRHDTVPTARRGTGDGAL